MAKSDSLTVGQPHSVKVAGKSLMLVRTPEGDLRVLLDRCPHRGARLSGGQMEERVESDEVGTYIVSEGYDIRCPWHRYRFDLETGICPVDQRQRVRVFEVVEHDGAIFVETGRD